MEYNTVKLWTIYIGNVMRSIISIAATGDNTVIYYDHWEDGYEADLANPVQATIEIWGDNNAGNVAVSWQAALDCHGLAVAGYNLYRNTTPGGDYVKINDQQRVDYDHGLPRPRAGRGNDLRLRG